MLESAIQQLLILTLFFGQSIWKAGDAFVAFVSKQFGIVASNGSQWIVGIYLVTYFVGGIFVAWVGWKTLVGFCSGKFNERNTGEFLSPATLPASLPTREKTNRRLWVILSILVASSVVLFFVAADTKRGWIAVAKAVSWTFAAIMLWYMLINPLFIKLIKRLLQKKEGRYSAEISSTLTFLPVLRQITTIAWRKSRSKKRGGRWSAFLAELIHSSLTYNEESIKPATVSPLKQTA